jgi:hypothetical protein
MTTFPRLLVKTEPSFASQPGVQWPTNLALGTWTRWSNSISEENMRHAILGAGGVGGLIGVALAKSGESVTLVLRPEALKDYPAELSLESPLGSFSFPVDRAATVAAPYDVLWITVKAT